MQIRSRFLLLVFPLFFGLATAHAQGRAEHVVVIVWDGLRPDFVRPQYAPTLYEFASHGTFFGKNHSAFVTSTEVNGTALATGMQPDHSGVMANYQYRPDLNWLAPVATEGLDAVRRGDFLTGGHYLEVPTVAETLQKAGFPTIIAGAKPIALLHDRGQTKVTQAQKDSVTLFRGQTLPRSVKERLTRTPTIGAFPSTSNAPVLPFAAPTEPATTNAPASGRGGGRRGGGGGADGVADSVDSWTAKALTRGLWRQSVPKYTLLWLSEPDASQHAHGVGSDEAVAGLENCDRNFASVLTTLEEKGVLDQTDIFVVSDHGFSSISRGPDLVQSLKRAKFNASKQFDDPEPGDVMAVNLGGSTALYVFDHDESVIRRLVTYLQMTDYAGVIFSSVELDGTFPLRLAHVAPGKGAPDVMVSFRWNDEPNDFGIPGSIATPDGKRGLGTHGSLSRYDLHNTLIAAGPDFKQGFVDELPSGNIDVAPTVLFLLGVKPLTPMDGRVLAEALVVDAPAPPEPVTKTREASRDVSWYHWHQHLTTSQMGYAVYYDEGNGESTTK